MPAGVPSGWHADPLTLPLPGSLSGSAASSHRKPDHDASSPSDRKHPQDDRSSSTVGNHDAPQSPRRHAVVVAQLPPIRPILARAVDSDQSSRGDRQVIRPILFLLPYLAIIGLCGLSAWQAGTSLRERAQCRAVALLAASQGLSEHPCP
jgi:hypothetical protein